jgi:hypothetical protein
MSTFVKAMQNRNEVTKNGMVTNSSSLSSCVDLFFTIGAYRSKVNDPQAMMDLIGKLEASFSQDPLLTRKMLFWVRDVRGGAGEREVFRKILRYLCHTYPKYVENNIHLIPEFGRWDDLFITFGTSVEDVAMEFIEDTLSSENSGLLAKWIPRTGGKISKEKRVIANKIRTHLGMTPRDFRKFIVSKTNVVEQQMCKKEFDKIEYQKVPSLAMSRYTNAFQKNDSEGYGKYISAVQSGEAKVNASAVYPYDIVKNLRYGDQNLSIEQWKALPNFMEGSKERVLPVCDVSGSMETPVSGITTALDVCISLGLYISERNEGPFKNAFITFSENPTLQYLQGDLRSRFMQLQSSEWGMNTNLEGTFKTILEQAKKNDLIQEEMPTCILIMSDMEFDQAIDHEETAMDMIRREFDSHGYDLPKIVFWNLNAGKRNIPVQMDENGTALISGFSPSILKSVLSGSTMTPESIMMETLNTERYSVVK